MSFDRRRFLQMSVLGTTVLGSPLSSLLGKVDKHESPESGLEEGLVIDTNVHLFQWPFRTLKYSSTKTLIKKLRQHGVRKAWAGNYEALFHKNIDGVNARLAEACNREGGGILIPFGTVNPRWPDWKEDLRRCDEKYGMPGIRLYPGYQNYTLDLPEFKELLQRSADRGMIVQIVVDQEDERMQHPMVDIPGVDVTPLPAVLEEAPNVKVQLLNPFRHVRGDKLRQIVEKTNVTFGISNLDGTGALERVMSGNHWYIRDIVIPFDRLLVGSHMPFRPLENVLFKFMESEMTEQEAAAIMADNANRLLRKT